MKTALATNPPHRTELWELSDGRWWEVRIWEDGMHECFSVLLNQNPDSIVGSGTTLSVIGAWNSEAEVMQYLTFYLRLDVVERVTEE